MSFNTTGKSVNEILSPGMTLHGAVDVSGLLSLADAAMENSCICLKSYFVDHQTVTVKKPGKRAGTMSSGAGVGSSVLGLPSDVPASAVRTAIERGVAVHGLPKQMAGVGSAVYTHVAKALQNAMGGAGPLGGVINGLVSRGMAMCDKECASGTSTIMGTFTLTYGAASLTIGVDWRIAWELWTNQYYVDFMSDSGIRDLALRAWRAARAEFDQKYRGRYGHPPGKRTLVAAPVLPVGQGVSRTRSAGVSPHLAGVADSATNMYDIVSRYGAFDQKVQMMGTLLRHGSGAASMAPAGAGGVRATGGGSCSGGGCGSK